MKIELTPRIESFTAADGYHFSVRVWKVDQPAARIVCLHGIISHGGWYLQSCRQLAEKGFEVHFVDRRGSGLNVAARGDVDRYETWLADVERYLSHLSDSLPRILIGISWGGKLATAMAGHRPDLVAGLGLLCPGLFAHQQANWLQRVALAILGRSPLQRFRVSIPLRDPTLFTGSHHRRNFIGTDPLTLRKITLRFALADRQLTRAATRLPEKIQTPTLLMLAGRDPIIDNVRVRGLVERFGGGETRIIEYPDAEHTLEFEPNAAEIVNDLEDWIRRTIAWAGSPATKT